MRILLDESLLPLAVVVLVAKSNRIDELRPLIPRLFVVLSSLPPRTLMLVGA